MSDLIKRENAIATIGVMYERCGGDITDYRDLLLQCFKDLPSGVVRCAECKHWYGESELYEDNEYKKCWQLQGQYMNSDFWCKYGERKGDE